MTFFEKIDRFVDSTALLITSSPNRGPARAVIYFLLVFFVLGIPYSLVRHVQTSGFHLVSVRSERKAGDKAAKQIERQMKLLPGNDSRALYVEEIGRRIAERNNPWSADFRFRTIENDGMINAFALPGGRIYISTGMLNRLDNEAELAIVLGHEVAHVSNRHYARNMGRQMLMSWVKKFLGGTDEAILDAGSFLTSSLTFLRMKQGDELEADYYGARYIYNLGYDPAAGVTLTEKLLVLESELPDAARAFVLTHPPSQERVRAMVELLDTLPEREGLVLGEDEYKKAINPKPYTGLKFPRRR